MAKKTTPQANPKPLTIMVPGKEIKTGGPAGQARAEDLVVQDHFGLVISATHAVEVGASARDGDEEIPLEEIDPGALVELTYEDGSREWLRADDLAERLPMAKRGATDEDIIHVPAFLPTGSTRAGFTGLVLKGLQVLGIDPVAAVADEISDTITPAVAEWYEDRLFTPADLPPGADDAEKEENNNRGIGLHAIDADGRLGPVLTDPIDDEVDDGPILVLLHGTFSTTAGSFGNLFRSTDWRTLYRFYGGRVYGLDHRTVSTGPAVNASDLIEKLPQDAALHLLSHSRGGLIGELLAHGPLTNGEIDSFRDHARPEQAALHEFSAQMAAKNLTIERFVRVACPVSGTTLASKRVDRVLSIILDLFELTPMLEDTLVYPFAKAVILSIIKEKEDPKTLPGLESMVPTSAYTRLFNLGKENQQRQSTADLAVIAGDIEGDGPFSRMSLRIADLFFGDDHDLVVNVRSMFTGVPRVEPVYYAYQQGPAIHHLNYFSNDASRKHAVNWLTQERNAPSKPDGFRKLDRGDPIPTVTRDSLRDQSVEDAPTLFVVPTVLGTELYVDGKAIWLDQRALAEGQIDRLAMDERNGKENLKAATGNLAPGGYNQLLDALSHRFKVVPFPYDWRKSLVDAGIALADEIEAALRADQSAADEDARTRPIYILAHGTGGMVARAMMVHRPNTWQRVMDRDGRVLLLGMPPADSRAVLQLLTGEARIMRMIALLDLAHDEAELARIFRCFPGLLELLPDETAYWDGDWWRDNGHFIASGGKNQELISYLKDRLKAAKAVREQLNPPERLSREEAEHIRCVVSRRDLMAQEDLLESDESFDFGLDNESGFSDALTWFMNASPGAMLRRRSKYRAYIDLLKRGTTDDLPRRVVARGGPRPQMRTEAEAAPVLFPSRAELGDAALGRRHRRRAEKRQGTLQISVAHGSLEHASYPVAVGHYFGDVIVGSEAFLDQRLDRKLTRRFGVKLYPGRVGTADVLVAPGNRPPGGLVVGLGDVGDLSPEILTDGVSRAALRYAMALLESGSPSSTKSGWISAAFSSVLIGTNGGRGLSVEGSVVAIVQGALLANRQLREQDLWNKVRIDAVEFIELYEDLATHAARVVSKLGNEYLNLPPGSDDEELLPADHLHKLEGGLPRGMPANYDGGWWRRVQIEAVRQGNKVEKFNFVMLTDRARAEETIQATQLPLIERIVRDAMRYPTYSDELHSALYELLLPNSIKEQALETANMVVVLDDEAARFPWEMLMERGREPLAIRSGLLRQLKTTHFRTDVRAPKGNNALVIGDPYLGNSQCYGQLAGAKAEAETVADTLTRYGYDVERCINEDEVTIISKLYAKEYRIIHIAAHGYYNEGIAKSESDNPCIDDENIPTGVLIGDGISLTAAEIGQLRVVPELVFLNCCHLARVDEGEKAEDQQAHPVAWTRLAASIAQELINIGVRAVIAAGWAVDDQAANDFAVQFYRQMTAEDKQFGDAVQSARGYIRSRHSHTNTWGAYQCYGMPSFMLGGRLRSGGSHDQIPVAKHEVINNLQRIRNSATDLSPSRRKELIAWVDDCERTLRDEWRTSDAFHALAETYADLGELETAIGYYERALKSNELRTQVPISAMEQLANLESRHARSLYQSDEKRAEKFLRRSIARLEFLIEQVGETSERHSLLGSCYKQVAENIKASSSRQAQDLMKALQNAAENYKQAYQLSGRGSDPYPMLNWVILQFLANADDDNQAATREFLGRIEAAERSALERQRKQPTFWERVNMADAALYRAILLNTLADEHEALVEQYKACFTTRSTASERDSVTRQIVFIDRVLRVKAHDRDDDAQKARDLLAENVASLYKALAE